MILACKSLNPGCCERSLPKWARREVHSLAGLHQAACLDALRKQELIEWCTSKASAASLSSEAWARCRCVEDNPAYHADAFRGSLVTMQGMEQTLPHRTWQQEAHAPCFAMAQLLPWAVTYESPDRLQYCWCQPLVLTTHQTKTYVRGLAGMPRTAALF